MTTRLMSQWRMPSRTVRRSARGEARLAAVCRDMCVTRNSGLGAVERGRSKTHARLQTTLTDLRGEARAEVLGAEAEERRVIVDQASRAV
jgi:hypothetical protein